MVQERMDGGMIQKDGPNRRVRSSVFPIKSSITIFFFLPPLGDFQKKHPSGLEHWGAFFPVGCQGFCRDFKAHFSDG